MSTVNGTSTGYYPTATANAAVPTPVTVNVGATPTPAAPVAPQDVRAFSSVSTSSSPTNLGMAANGPILPLQAQAWITGAAKTVPAGTMAAIGAATAIAKNTNGTMMAKVAKAVGDASEPLFKLSWGLVANVADTIGALVTFRFGDAIRNAGKIFSEGAATTGGMLKRLTQPATLTAATAGGTKLGVGGAIGAGLSIGLKALKSSFIWAIPAAAINGFVDYKFKDQTDTKRLGTNFAADVLGYTATGVAGAAVGAAVGSMTLPIIGTVVGAGVGILLGMAHDKITRPLISDYLRDQMG
jgi:hypothetical protein